MQLLGSLVDMLSFLVTLEMESKSFDAIRHALWGDQACDRVQACGVMRHACVASVIISLHGSLAGSFAKLLAPLI